MATKTRKTISAKTRFDIFKRDGFVCQYCGAHPPKVLLEADHIVPVADGGGNETDNLIAACWTCNRGKAARSLDDIPISLQQKAVDVAEREAQLRGYHDVMEAKRQRLDDDVWRVAKVYMQHFRDDSIYKNALQSIKTFVDRLGVHETLDAMEIAVARKPYSKNTAFKYFCGICWTKIREQDA